MLTSIAMRAASSLQLGTTRAVANGHGLLSSLSFSSSSRNADVVVAGTGVLGHAIARELALAGEKVTLVGPEPQNSAASATLASGAMIDAFGELEHANEPMVQEQLQLRVAAQRKFRSWISNLEEDTGRKVYWRPGITIIGNSGGDHDVSKLAFMKAALSEFDESYESIAPKDIQGLAPNVQYQAHSAIHIPGALTVDSHGLLGALAASAIANKNVWWHKQRCQNVYQLPGRMWELKLQDGSTVTTPKLVLSAGAFSASLLGEQLWAAAGVPDLHFGRGTAVIVSGMPSLPQGIRTPNRALACGLHIVPRADGMWYVGSTNLFGTNMKSAGGPTCGELHTLLGQTAAELNTSLRNATVQSVCWGLRPVTAFGLPVFGATKLEGLFVATGTHRQGVNIAPEVSRLVADNVLTGAANHAFLPASPNTRQGVDLALGVRSLIATTLYPTGSMPYNRQRELEVFVTALLQLAISDPSADIELQGKLQQLSTTIGMSEQCVIRLFHEVLEKLLPQQGPYVT